MIVRHCVFGLMAAMLSLPSAADERVLFQFEQAAAGQPWRAVNDGVMGGRSVGRFRINNEHKLEFFGTLSLENNGGFASVRARADHLAMAPGQAIRLRVRGDGRTYNLNLYTQGDLRGYSYRQAFSTVKDEWVEVTLPVDQFVATWRGRVFPNVLLDPGQIAGIGFLLGDKQPGPFRLEVDWIAVAE